MRRHRFGLSNRIMSSPMRHFSTTTPLLATALLLACGTGAPALSADRASLDFIDGFGDGTKLGMTTGISLGLTNTGSGTLHLGALTVTGPDAAAFTVTPPASTALEPQQSTSVVVTFQPTEAREYSATLDVASNAGNAASMAFPLLAKGMN
jgi:hypothetical protein